MRKIIGLIWIVLVFSACMLKREKVDLKKVKLTMEMLKDKPKGIDTSVFNKYIEKLKKKGPPYWMDLSDTVKMHLKDDPQINIRRRTFRLGGGEYILTEYNSDGETIRETRLLQYFPEIQVDEKIDKYFNSFNKYYISGSIKSRLVRSIFNFYLGKQYYYNEDGNMIDIIDTDDGYQFTYEDALKFYVRKWGKLVDDKYGMPVKIDKGTLPKDKNRKIWILTHQDKKTGLSDIYQLDALSGKVIEKFRVDQRERI